MEEQNKTRRGRKKIVSLLGERKNYNFSMYPSEYKQMNNLFQKLKSERPKYQIKCK